MGSPEKCDKCGGVGSHVEGKRGFTRFPCPNATPTPPAPAMRHWQHDETGRVCDCVDCPGPRYHEVNEAFAEAHEKAMREKCGAPAPADDAREKGLAAYDALNMREKSEIAAQDPRYCYAKGYVAALAGRADDASGAEAMREAWAYAVVNAQGKRTGVIHADRSRLVPIVEADNDDDLAGGPFRIVPLAPLPATDDAVEEALTAAQALIRHLSQGMAGLARADGDMERLYFVPKIVAAYAAFNEVGAKIDAALRREKGGDK